jgi:hypothetical protein
VIENSPAQAGEFLLGGGGRKGRVAKCTGWLIFSLSRLSIVGGMENLNAEKIDNYIDEFFLMERGEKISNPNGKILFFGEICVSRRSLKHVELYIWRI